MRFSWSNLPLEDEVGEPIDLLRTLESLPEASRTGRVSVFFRMPEGESVAARLVAIRKSDKVGV